MKPDSVSSSVDDGSEVVFTLGSGSYSGEETHKQRNQSASKQSRGGEECARSNITGETNSADDSSCHVDIVVEDYSQGQSNFSGEKKVKGLPAMICQSPGEHLVPGALLQGCQVPKTCV